MMNAEFKKGPWRVLASAALGTALAGSALMGAAVPAQAAAAAVPPGTMTVAPGGTAGSGVVSIVAETGLHFEPLPGVANQPSTQTFTQGFAVTIGSETRQADTASGVFDHQEVSDYLGFMTETTTFTRIDIPYSCQPAGTPVTALRTAVSGQSVDVWGAAYNTPTGSPATIPDNGPLPAACGGGSVDPQPSAPEASLSPQTGEAGATFTVTGKGFPASATVGLSWDEPVATLGTAATDAAGNFSVALTVPSGSAAGAHSVLVLGEETITLPFTVTAASVKPAPMPSLTPQSGPAGSAFTVNGTGYLPGSSITVSFGEAAAILGTVEVAADGTFAFNGTVPQDAASGAHTVYVLSHESGSQELTFTVGTPETDPGNGGGEDPGTDPGTDPGHNGDGHNTGHDGDGHNGDWHGGDVVGDGHDGAHGGNNADSAADIDYAATGNGATTTGGSQDAATADRGLNLQTAVEHPATPWLAAGAGLAALAAGVVLFLRRRNAG
ncbi:hypothetical protein SCMU_28710 [Sinomonas cyclohexanicum]|uniref:Gram-positive cocci surface proteins LPxTG domain-containing protein n=1 Tax=Sinomonas cyclohexanicum TaxID=322009 RepID=A0ABM7PXK3_SINCY|nr:hypothetical protein [Corynebacterium cyclohexanicum]BCT77029.1 hypothetical protein SCMU_28710 [Corynebacterium cyclohexanicum]